MFSFVQFKFLFGSALTLTLCEAVHERDTKTSLYFETKLFDWPMDKPESLEHKEKERAKEERDHRRCRPRRLFMFQEVHISLHFIFHSRDRLTGAIIGHSKSLPLKYREVLVSFKCTASQNVRI